MPGRAGIGASPPPTALEHADAGAYGVAVAAGGLPDVKYQQTTLKLFGKYALNKSADIRIDLVHQRAKFEEWTWGYSGIPFVYSDNSSVNMQPNQDVTYLGAAYIYRIK